ncbi:MAG: hypothetical protein IJY39_10165 [Clostridia bacterium]|nr:hypothetical protein [Clostridia bacterium]
MKMNLTDAQRLLASRAEDHLSHADRGELVCGNFLTPSEAAFSLTVMRELRAADRAFLFGGYADAERKRIFVIPSYLSDFDGDAEEKAREYFAEELRDAVKAIRIQGSGYKELSHRDYLGALLAMGIERDALGDIVTQGAHAATVFCTGKIFPYLLSGIERIGADKVTVEEFVPDESFASSREFLPVHDTVASNRLDCVVGALTNLSREKAQAAIRSGLCEVDYLPEQRVDAELKVPCTVTVRGYGKFNVLSFDGETRRGRLRLVAQKYV